MERRELNLRDYWRIAFRWWWIILLGMLGGAVAMFLVSGAQTPIYNASIKILVQSRQDPGLPSFSEIEASREIARNYGELVKTRPILSQTIADAGLPYTTGKLRSKISVGTSRSFITIIGKDPDPVLAAKIANTTAQAFIDDFRRRQFTEIASFQASLDQFGIQNDPSIVAAQASAISTLSIVEQADPPGSPSSPNTKLNIILGVGLGLLVAGLLIILLEYLNDRIRSAEEVKAITGLDALGSVLSYEPADRHLPLTIVDEEQADMLSESYKLLQTNIDLFVKTPRQPGARWG